MEAIFILIFLPANCSSFLWQRNKNFQSGELQCVTWILHFYLNFSHFKQEKKRERERELKEEPVPGRVVWFSGASVERWSQRKEGQCTSRRTLFSRLLYDHWLVIPQAQHGLRYFWFLVWVIIEEWTEYIISFVRWLQTLLKKWPSHLKFKYIFLSALYNRVYSKSMLSTLAAHLNP